MEPGLYGVLVQKAQISRYRKQERPADMATSAPLISMASNQQMSMITDDLNHLPQHIKGSKVDIILCNPPYLCG